jgi:hypothetical protein
MASEPNPIILGNAKNTVFPEKKVLERYPWSKETRSLALASSFVPGDQHEILLRPIL